VEDTGELYQFSSIYRHFILNRYAVVRGRFDGESTKPYYLCTVVLFDISKDSDIVNSHELLPGDATDQHARYKHGEEENAGMEGGGERRREVGR
jgi:hypothetical protein